MPARKTKPEPLPVEQRFQGRPRVKINYSINNPVVPYRYGYVIEDNGGLKVKVRWKAQDGSKVGRNVVAYHGRTHEQWIPRERLELAERPWRYGM